MLVVEDSRVESSAGRYLGIAFRCRPSELSQIAANSGKATSTSGGASGATRRCARPKRGLKDRRRYQIDLTAVRAAVPVDTGMSCAIVQKERTEVILRRLSGSCWQRTSSLF